MKLAMEMSMKESMRRLALRIVALALPGLLLVATNLRAEILSPDVLVRQTSEEVLRGVADDKELRNGNATRFIELIETKVVPHFDMQKMTRLAVSKSWETGVDRTAETVGEGIPDPASPVLRCRLQFVPLRQGGRQAAEDLERRG
ncbi:MAG: ABC transporter substrate-binding protein [Betaproteobacteria bacterium]|nr:ABC transporter substrate-binding protein [Betaproteobacteria bacterium]